MKQLYDLLLGKAVFLIRILLQNVEYQHVQHFLVADSIHIAILSFDYIFYHK